MAKASTRKKKKIPPKSLRDDAQRRCQAANEEDNELAELPTLNPLDETARSVPVRRTPESLPVLHAFQEFLDVERRRMRNRIVGLSVFFTLVVLLVGVGSVLVGMVFLDMVQQDIDDVHAELAAFSRDAAEHRGLTEAALSALDRQTGELSSQVAMGTAELKEADAAMGARMSGQAEQVASLRSVMSAVETENALLRKELATLRTDMTALRTDLPAISNRVVSMVREIAELRAPAATPIPSNVEAGEASAPQLTHVRLPPVELELRPPGVERSVIWRLPIPE